MGFPDVTLSGGFLEYSLFNDVPEHFEVDTISIEKPRYNKVCFSKMADDLLSGSLTQQGLQFRLYQLLDRRNGIRLEKLTAAEYANCGLSEENIQAGTLLYRDARNAKPLPHRENPNSFVPMASQLILRSSSILQGATHLLQYAKRSTHLTRQASENIEVLLSKGLLKAMTSLLKSLDDEKNQDIISLKALERNFNFSIIKALSEANVIDLNDDQLDDKSLAKFLIELRYLGALLTETPAVHTVSQEGKGPHAKLITQTSDPICKKTAEQKQKIKQYINHHFSDNNPFSRLYQAFKPQLCSDKTMNSPQQRFVMPYGLRQAFYESTRICNSEGRQITSKHHIRCASTAFVGNKLTRDEKVEAATLNMQQVQTFLDHKNDKRNILHMPLLAETKHRHQQDVMCSVMRDAARSLKVKFSLLPVSFFSILGRLLGFFKPEVKSSMLQENANNKQLSNSGFTQSQRLKYASNVMTAIKTDSIAVFGCASNQNRSGILALCANGVFAKIHKIFRKTKRAISHFVETGHELFSASQTAPGSAAMKAESRVNGLFYKSCDKHLYGSVSQSRTSALLPSDTLLQLREEKYNNASCSPVGFFAYNQSADAKKVVGQQDLVTVSSLTSLILS